MVPARAWKVWAKLERERDGRRLGYPSRAPYSRPELTGYPDEPEDADIGHLSPDDEELGEQVGKAVSALYRLDWRPGWALYIRWRASSYIQEEWEEARKLGWTLDELHAWMRTGQEWCDARLEERAGACMAEANGPE